MAIHLSDHFGYRRILRFTAPSILMMIFTSIYGVVDGFFVSNFAGKTPFAAVNFIMPFLMILSAFGFMIGTGGTAVVSKAMGEGRETEAKRYFSFLVFFVIVGGIVLAVLGIGFLRPICRLLGAEGELLEYCVIYGRIILAALPAYMLQTMFQSFLITAERPKLGLAVTVGAGVANMVLDFLLVYVFPFGIVGAAVATAASQAVGGIVPLVYFCGKKGRVLHFTRFSFYGKVLLRTCTNGSSELMSNISMSLVGILYNNRLLALAGENGIAAYGVIMYVNFIFVAIFIGYSIGVAPIIGYHYGACHRDELKNLLKKSTVLVGLGGITLTAIGIGLSYPLSHVFVGYDVALLEMTVRGLVISSLSFLFCGFGIFGSSFFTALGNGAVSAIISFFRTMVFQVGAILLLAAIWELDGIWFSISIAEGLAAVMTVCWVIAKRKKYGYL
ncbi:MAG: MATE family efflux transporter [Clostridia bacterium]|nr:MATE family efflux transporter [Clostridia bacterium]